MGRIAKGALPDLADDNQASPDAGATPKSYRITDDGHLVLDSKGPGDGVGLRSSALLDERSAEGPPGALESPIQWDQVLFIFADHLGLTENPAFTNNILILPAGAPTDADTTDPSVMRLQQ